MANILIIDDDYEIGLVLEDLAETMEHGAKKVQTREEGLDLARRGNYDLIFLDIEFPGGSGLEILADLMATPSAPEVIIITGSGTEGAEVAFKHGAWDYVQKPFNLSEVSLHISRALEFRQKKMTSREPVRLKRTGIIGDSPAISRCLDAVGTASATDAGVLITGETGTGKELFAHAIHENSRRSGKSFAVVDCGSLPESLVEGILFGHEKGAFTGANSQSKGLVAQANGGTLFLDEIGELPISAQKSFLRVLQEKSVRPLGGDREIPVDFRLVAATNRNLEAMVAEGRFRQDLLFRIRAIEIPLPPLRERKEDIRAIALHVVERICRQYDMGMKGIGKEYFDVLAAQPWPGNVRELINVLENSLAAAARDTTLVPKHIPYQYRTARLRETAREAVDIPAPEEAAPDADDARAIEPLKAYRETCEERYLHHLLKVADGDREKACLLSGISQSQLYSLLKKHNLSRFKQ